MAWLNATPKPPEGTKRAAAKQAPPAPSRIDRMKSQGIAPQMPANPAPHIIDRLIEMGLTEAAGMGAGPIGWTTMAAWSALTGIPLQSWEARLLRKLSSEYLAESRKAESENCPPPWRGTITEREKQVEVAGLRMVLG